MVRKTLIIVTFSLIVILIQLLFGTWMTIREVRPDFVLMLVLFVGRLQGKVLGQLYGFTIGLIADGIGIGSFMGLSALAKTVAGFGAGLLKGKRHRYNPLLLHGLEIFIIGLHFAIYYFINFKGLEIATEYLFMRYILPSTAYTALFYLIMQYLFKLDID